MSPLEAILAELILLNSKTDTVNANLELICGKLDVSISVLGSLNANAAANGEKMNALIAGSLLRLATMQTSLNALEEIQRKVQGRRKIPA